MTHEQRKDMAERCGFYDIAFIQLTSIKHPYLDKSVKHYYRLFRLSPKGPVHIVTSIRSKEFLQDDCANCLFSIERLIANSQVNKRSLKSLSSYLVRTEIARAIVDMNKYTSYSDKAPLRSEVITDARYMIPPYTVKYVQDGKFISGEISNIWYDTDEGANMLEISSEDCESTVVKHHGEVNIPFMQWRKLHES